MAGRCQQQRAGEQQRELAVVVPAHGVSYCGAGDTERQLLQHRPLLPSPAPNLTTTNRSENFRLYLAIVARPHSQTPRSAMAFVYLSRATSPATHSLPRLILKRSGLRIASSSSFRHQKLLEARGNAYCKRSEACTAISREEMAVNCS